MLKTGILNPHINSLLSRVRHTNYVVIADRGFPCWPMIETIDITLTDNIPTVLDVLTAIRSNFSAGVAFMAEEFFQRNSPETQEQFTRALGATNRIFEPHIHLKKRVPAAIGLIRTADTTQYANVILESA